MKRLVLWLVVGLLASANVATAGGDKKTNGPGKEDIQRAEAQVKEFLAKIKGESGQILYLGNEPLDKSFPQHRFFAVRYRIYPVAKVLPEGMHPSNVFAVPVNGRAEHIKDTKALENFFKTNMTEAKSERAAMALVESWLTLTPEFRQDGFFKFKIADETKIKGQMGGIVSATGKTIVMAGGNGEISATLTLDVNGKLTNATESAKIKTGPRPICQATKLLDNDPLVRRICEQDLLYLGRLALDYLQEQRNLARPELRQVIDRLVERILREDE